MLKVFCAKRQDAKELAARLIGNRDLTFSLNQYGKPSVAGAKDIYFNATHTKNKTFIALSDEEVGIDAEDIEDYDDRIPLSYFTKDEQTYLNNSRNKKRAFFEIWTLKESYMKYQGKGFHLPPQGFSVLKGCDCYFYHEITYNIALSVCSKREQPIGEIRFLKEN